MTADSLAFSTSSEVIGAVNKLESSVIPLLASPQGGVAASSSKFRAATEADAAGVVFLLFSSENHPGLAIQRRLRNNFFDRSATPPCGDARRGITLDPISSQLLWPPTMSKLRDRG